MTERSFFQWLLRIYVWLLAKAYGLENIYTGDIVKMNYVVKADNPAVGFSISAGEVKDSEGHVIADARLSYEVSSTDESVIAIALNEDGKSGQVSFGTVGQASVVVNVKDQNGNLLGTGGDNFTLVPGDPASVSGVATTFEGLTPVEEPTEPEVPADPAPPADPEVPADPEA